MWAGAQSPAEGAGAASWTVKPEWVRAHEEFLASDAMRGRGSATHDEEVAATYVASEFVGYGLQPAPGMSGYLQSAAVVSPVLDGHAHMSVGGVTLEQGTDFTLLMSQGANLTGPLQRVDLKDAEKVSVATGSVVLLTGAGSSNDGLLAAQELARGGAAAVLLSQSSATDRVYTMGGGKTRVPVRLREQQGGGWARPSIVALNPTAIGKLSSTRNGDPVTLSVRMLPPEGPRHTFNAIGYLPGSDPNAGTILLSAHLDHLGTGRAVNGDSVYNGANDDAAGTTAVLELAHALANGPRLRRGVLFVCYGSEEAGELGSTYFGEHPPVPLKDLVANLEFEMIGNQDPKMPKGTLLLTGWDRSNLGVELKAHGALLGPDPYPEQHYFERSDNYALALRGVVAHTAAGWGDPPTYHQPSDDLAHLDLPFMTAAIQSLVEPMRWLASSDFVPQWNEGGRPKRE